MRSERGEEEMRQAQFRHATMVSPAPGFTIRVMARIEARERARARRQAIVGAGLLFLATGVVSALLAGLLLSVLGIVLMNPDVFIATLVSLTPLVDFVTTIAEALWIAVGVLAENISAAQMLTFALGVLALTLLWVRVVTGSPLRLLTLPVGGFEK